MGHAHGVITIDIAEVDNAGRGRRRRDMVDPYVVNSLNHSIGQPELYPFVLAPTVMGKLGFVHGLIHGIGEA